LTSSTQLHHIHPQVASLESDLGLARQQVEGFEEALTALREDLLVRFHELYLAV
jgi:hypothetical protein